MTEFTVGIVARLKMAHGLRGVGGRGIITWRHVLDNFIDIPIRLFLPFPFLVSFDCMVSTRSDRLLLSRTFVWQSMRSPTVQSICAGSGSEMSAHSAG